MTGYRQEMRDGIPVKVRRVKHKAKDGGCDEVFETYEAISRVVNPRKRKEHRIENENGNEQPTTVNNEQGVGYVKQKARVCKTTKRLNQSVC